MWPLAVALGTKAIQGGLARSAQNKAAIADNNISIDMNNRNTLRAGVKSGLLLMQEASSRRQQVRLQYEMEGQAAEALGSIDANTAAAGQAGASARAVASDVQRKLDTAQADAEDDWELKAQNYLTQMDDIWMGLRDSISSGRGKAPGNFLMDIAGAAVSVAGNYAGAKMTLGLGK